MSGRTPSLPDMGGLKDDWDRLATQRQQAATRPPADPEPERDDDQEQRPAGRRPSRPGRTRGGKRPPPAAADAVPTTIRFDPAESSEVDRFVLELRDEAGRRALDKAEVIREVLRLAREHEPTRRALLRRLR